MQDVFPDIISLVAVPPLSRNCAKPERGTLVCVTEYGDDKTAAATSGCIASVGPLLLLCRCAGINLVTNLQHNVGISWILQHGQAPKNQLCSAVAALLSKRKTLKFCRLYSSRNL